LSLIDDALKRAQEATRAGGAQPEARPWTPAPLPDAGLARRRRIMRSIAWSLAVAAALGTGGFLIRTVWDASAPATERPAVAPVVTPPAPAPTLAETVVTTPVAPAVAPARPRPTRIAEPDGPTSSAESAPAGEPAAPAAPRPIADGRNYVGAVDLPGGGRIELGGIVWSENEPRALLNDRIVGTGGYVEGFTVSKIEENRVVLEKDGVTISISLK
jgi:hypothetical protein